MRLRRWTAVTLALIAVAGLAACSQSTSGTPAQSALAQAMDSVSGSGPAAAEFAYGDLAGFRELGVLRTSSGEVNVDKRWQLVVGIGTNTLVSHASALSDTTGIDVLSYDTAVHIGTPPDTAIKLTGEVPVETIRSKYTEHGAQARTFGQSQGLSLAADDQVDLAHALVPGLTSQLNQLVLNESTVVLSPNSASLQAALGESGDSLLDTGSYEKVAGCLGDVLVAMIVHPNEADAVRTVAVGVRVPASGDKPAEVHEVLCAVPAKGKSSHVLDAMKSTLSPSATDPVTKRPLSQFISASSVTTRGSLVQAVLTLKADAPVGFLINGVLSGQSERWVDN